MGGMCGPLLSLADDPPDSNTLPIASVEPTCNSTYGLCLSFLSMCNAVKVDESIIHVLMA